MATKFPKGIIDCGPSVSGSMYRIPNATMRTTGKVNCFFINVPWSALQTTNDGAIVANNPIDQALAALRAINISEPGVNLTMAIRVFAGAYAPTYAKNLQSGPVDIWDSFDGKYNTMGKFWVPPTTVKVSGAWTTMADAYADFNNKLATVYDNVPEIVGQTVSLGALFYPEQFLNSASQRNDVVGQEGPFTINTTSTGAQMVAKGFTNAAGKAAIQLSWLCHTAWVNTCTIVAFNPASLVSDSGGTAATDEAFTESCIDAFVTAFPGKACLSNYSLRKYQGSVGGPSPKTTYMAMYNKMISKSVPIVYQTARKARICEFGTVNADATGACWPEVYDWATTTGRAWGIETINEYQADYDPIQVAAFDAIIDTPAVVPERTIIALPDKRGNIYRWWDPRWATGVGDSHTQVELEATAVDCEIVICHYNQLHASSASTRSARVQQMHDAALAAGHECVVATYVNGTFGSSGKTPASLAYPDEAYMHSTSLTHPYLSDSGGTWLMDPRSRYWNDSNLGFSSSKSLAEDAEDRRVGKFTTPHADGFIIDNLGWGVVTSGYNGQRKGDGTWGAAGSDVANYAASTKESPTNTKTGGTYAVGVDRAAWTELTKYLAAQVYARSGHEGNQPVAFYVNGGSQGNRFFDSFGPTNVLSSVSMMVMFENWVRNATDPLDPTQTTPTGSQKALTDWVKDVNCVLYLQNKGRGALLYVKHWDNAHTHTTSGTASNGTILISSADDDGGLAALLQSHRVIDASYLLVTSGRSFMHHRHDHQGGDERVPQCQWYNRINLIGWPTERVTKAVASDGTGGIDDTVANGGLKQADGTYRRLFTNGVVIVNPNTTSKTVTLPTVPTGTTQWKDVDQTTYTSGQSGISMPRNTAFILRGV